MNFESINDILNYTERLYNEKIINMENYINIIESLKGNVEITDITEDENYLIIHLNDNENEVSFSLILPKIK